MSRDVSVLPSGVYRVKSPYFCALPRMSEAQRTAAEAYAFRQLVAHLQQRTDVQNIELMILSGFCRNCLSKWYHVGAAKAGSSITYEDACERVYGMSYKDWKQTHQSKASEEQLKRLEETKAGHAKHEAPPPVSAQPEANPAGEVPKPPAPVAKSSMMSDVCCEPPHQLVAAALASQGPVLALPDVPSPPCAVDIRLGILTISDRAAQGVYADLSGPEVAQCMQVFAGSQRGSQWRLSVTKEKVVGDEAAEIAHELREWSAGEAAPCNLILTTGGTGLAPRDVTPEATASVLDRLVSGIPEILLREALKHEPLAALSRAVAGTRGKTLIVNLPGRPKAVRENLAVLMPLLAHALLHLPGHAGAAAIT